MADEVMFGTPETWGKKVGQFIEEKEYIIPQPKPQDVIEQRRKDSLRKFLFDYPGAVEQETVDYIKDYIKRENFGVKGTSKILPKLNAEAQEEFGKNWDKLNADDKQLISSRVRAREASALKKVDPAKNQNILRQKATEKKLKDFAAEFKKENGRPPMIKEIKEGVGTADAQIKKYLKKSEYATPQQALKFKTPKEAKAIPDEMKNWFKTNYPGKDWGTDLTINERGIAKEKFKNRNNPRVLARGEYKKLDDFLQKRIDDGETLFKGGLGDIAKEAGADLTPLQTGSYINSRFPGELVYRGTKIGEVPKIRKRVAELAKTLTDKQIYEKLVEEKLINPSGAKEKVDYKNVRNLMKDLQEEGKIKNIIKNPLSQYTPQEEKFRDDLIKKYINKNPDVDNAFQIAKGVVRENPELKMSSNFVKKSVERQGLDKAFKSRHAKIFPEVQALDKIIKNLPELKLGEALPKNLKERVLIEYAEATGKNIAEAEGELVSRMRKLGTLYTGDVGRYETDLYKKIKTPKNYIDSNFQKNFITLTDRTGEVSNIHMAKLLGLPKSEQRLIQGTANMFSAFDFDVAGDHTDIKAMMRDFPGYKKNFSRIEYIKDTLNDFKQTYDSRINALRKAAENVTGQAQKDLLDEANEIASEFESKTGYRVGTFDLKKGRVAINPQTLRLPDLKNPFNETLQQAMENFEQTKNPKLGGKAATVPEEFTGLDKKLMESTASERAKIFKDVAGTREAKESLYLKALQKVPKIGKIATAVIGGTAGAAAITTLAQADEPGVEDEDSVLPEAAIGTAAVAPLATKTGRNIYGTAGKGLLKALRVLGQPSVAAGFAVDEARQGNIKTAGASLLAPELVGSLAPAGRGILSTIGKFAMNPFGKAARAFTPLGLATIAAGGAYDLYKEYERRKELTPEERLEEDLERDKAAAEMMIGAADGGLIRLGLADGPKKKGLKNPGRREFMKTTGKLAGIAALLPYGIGKGVKIATKAAPAVGEGFKLGMDKLMLLVDKIKLLGKDVTPKYGTKEREQVTLYQGKDGASYELAEDLSTGDIRVTRDVEGSASYGDRSYDTIEDRTEFQIRKGEVYVKDEGLETQKAIQAPDEYEEGRAVFDQDGTVADIDDVDDAVIEAIEDEIK